MPQALSACVLYTTIKQTFGRIVLGFLQIIYSLLCVRKQDSFKNTEQLLFVSFSSVIVLVYCLQSTMNIMLKKIVFL